LRGRFALCPLLELHELTARRKKRLLTNDASYDSLGNDARPLCHDRRDLTDDYPAFIFQNDSMSFPAVCHDGRRGFKK